MKIAVIGSRGTLGSALMNFWNSPLVWEKIPTRGTAAANLPPEDELVPFDLPEFDVTSRRFTLDALTAIRPNVIVNASGINLLDWVEEHPNTARTIHVQGTANLREAARRTGAILVQFGCAEVFYSGPDDSSVSAAETRPKTEDDIPNPESIYAKTKLDSERAASEAPRFLILRTGPLFGGVGSQSSGNFVETVLRSSRRTRALQVVRDIRVSPIFTLDLLRALRFLLDSGATGRFHLANGGSATLDELARKLLDLCGLTRHEVRGISASDYGYKAPRSRFAVLETARYRALDGSYPLPNWTDALGEYIDLRRESRFTL